MALALRLPAVRSATRPLALAAPAEIALVLALVGLAAALRWPYLYEIPELTDESSEIWRAFQIYRGELLPLTNFTSFVGPLWNYLVAGLFWLSGPSITSPRLLVMLLGALTVAPTYLLGRELGGRWAGLLAAALLATNGGHIVSNSHIAWSNCITPLFGTTACWLLARAANRQSGLSLVGGGLAAGLALLTHGTFLFLLPGLGLFVLWKARPLLRTRWPLLALAAFLLGFWPLIVFNLQSGFRTVSEAEARAGRTRQQQLLPTPAAYLQRGGVVLTSALRLTGGAINEREGSPAAYLLDPLLLAYGALGLAGLGYAWRRGQPLPALAAGSSLLLWPLFNQKVEALPQEARYLMPLLPPVFAAVGLLAAAALARAGRAAPLVGALLALLVLGPLLPLREYYADKLATGRLNQVGYVVAANVEQALQPGERVLLDAGINRYSFGGNGGGQRTFRQLFGLRAIAAVELELGDELTDYVRCGQSSLVVLRAMEYRKLGEPGASLQTDGVQLSAVAPPGPDSPVFGVYRASRPTCPGRRG